LTDCKNQKNSIQDVLAKSLGPEFAKFGITISNAGLVGGLTYENSEIQTAINNAYVAEMKIRENEQSKAAQIHENERILSIAVTERQAAQEFAKAYEAMVKKLELEIAMKKADAMLVAAGKLAPGILPSSILPQGSNLLFGLDAGK